MMRNNLNIASLIALAGGLVVGAAPAMVTGGTRNDYTPRPRQPSPEELRKRSEQSALRAEQDAWNAAVYARKRAKRAKI